jgi:hypothetical protein
MRKISEIGGYITVVDLKDTPHIGKSEIYDAQAVSLSKLRNLVIDNIRELEQNIKDCEGCQDFDDQLNQAEYCAQKKLLMEMFEIKKEEVEKMANDKVDTSDWDNTNTSCKRNFNILELDDNTRCYCPKCKGKKVSEEIKPEELSYGTEREETLSPSEERAYAMRTLGKQDEELKEPQSTKHSLSEVVERGNTPSEMPETLKTLKDLPIIQVRLYPFEEAVDINKLRKEAIRWVKNIMREYHLEKYAIGEFRIEKCDGRDIIATMHRDVPENERQREALTWISMFAGFFNLAEDEIRQDL